MKLKEWGRRIIRAVAHAFNPSGRSPALIYDGFYNWHGNENTRQPVGEVLHSRVQEMAGIEHVQAIGYIYADQADLRTAINLGHRDCCSIEADVVTHEEPGGRYVVDDIERATGVVLGHTSKQLPGFAGAVVRKLSEFGPADGAPALPGSTGANAGTAGALPAVPVPPAAAPAAAPVLPVTAAPAGGQQFSRADLIAAIKSSGLTLADLTAAPVAPAVVIVAPPAAPLPPAATEVDLRDPQYNEFL